VVAGGPAAGRRTSPVEAESEAAAGAAV
jgi:hypothetical protein